MRDLSMATRAASSAAAAVGVEVRALSDLHDLQAVVDLFSDIWGRSANPPVNIELLRAFAEAGAYVSGAFERQWLVGAVVGFFHPPADAALHSHIAGVRTRGRNVGFAIKLHQRMWSLQRGVSEIVWTFDPLVSRNAYFNITKLGAKPVQYIPNFYGPLRDAVNGDDDSDRLLLSWRLRDPGVVAACAGEVRPVSIPDELTAGAAIALDTSPDRRPEAGRSDAATCLVAAPRDIEGLRASQPDVARDWRRAVRETLAQLLADGARITGFHHDGWYVVRRPSTGVTP